MPPVSKAAPSGLRNARKPPAADVRKEPGEIIIPRHRLAAGLFSASAVAQLNLTHSRPPYSALAPIPILSAPTHYRLFWRLLCHWRLATPHRISKRKPLKA